MPIYFFSLFHTGGFKDEMKVCDLISGQPMFMKLLSPKLDVESRTIGNWRSLATEFGIRKQKTEQFGLRGSGPAGALFLHMRAAEGLCDLTMGQLLDHFQLMERKDLVNMLNKQQPKIESMYNPVCFVLCEAQGCCHAQFCSQFCSTHLIPRGVEN